MLADAQVLLAIHLPFLLLTIQDFDQIAWMASHLCCHIM